LKEWKKYITKLKQGKLKAKNLPDSVGNKISGEETFPTASAIKSPARKPSRRRRQQNLQRENLPDSVGNKISGEKTFPTASAKHLR
jgi:hypothetical protein